MPVIIQGGGVNPPVQLDPVQTIVGVSWPSGFVAAVGAEAVVNFFTGRKLRLSGGTFVWGQTVAEILYDVAFQDVPASSDVAAVTGRVVMGGAPVFADSDQFWVFDAAGNQILALLPFPDVESADLPTQQGVRAIAIDSQGDMIVGGRYPFSSLPPTLDPNLKKYTPAGSLLWAVLINPNATPTTSTDQHYPERIVIDASDNIFIRSVAPGSGEPTLYKVSSAGAKLWQITRGAYPGSITREDFGTGSSIALDQAGTGVYVAARQALTSGPEHIKHVDAAGSVSTGPEFDSFVGSTALATNGDGHVYASGWMTNETDDPAVLRKYMPGSDPADLTLIGSITLGVGSVNNRFVRLVATDDGGVVGCSPTGNIARYDADGNVLWQTAHGANLNSIAVTRTAAGSA